MCRPSLLLALSVSLCPVFVACLGDTTEGSLDALDVVSLDLTEPGPDSAATDVDSATSTDSQETETTVAPETVDDTLLVTEVSDEDTTAVTEVADEDTTVATEVAAEDTTVTEVEDTVEPETVEPETIEDDTFVATEIAEETIEDVVVDVAPEVVEPEELPPADVAQLSAPPYLMWVTKTEVSVRWETKTPVVGRVDFGPSDSLGTTLVEPEPRTTHELRLTGLPPNHRNSYRVVYGGGALPVRHFWTAPPDDSVEPLNFVVWGDNQNGPGTFEELVPVMADHDPRFAFSVGDCVQNGTRGEYRSQLFGPMSGFADEVPYLVAAGNHERYSDPNALLFAEYFSQPADEHCFGWRYGGFFLLIIDTDLTLPQQRACIDGALSSDLARTAKIQAAAFHKPPRVEWWFGGQIAFTDDMEAPWVREELEPILESYDVDVVFNGHNHLYAHTPETDGGIVWVTTGGAGGMLDTRGAFDFWRVGNWPEIETTLHEFHILRAVLEDDELLIEAVDLDGEVIHSFYVFGD